MALFNGARYWHAHEKWETLWRAAPDDERDFYQGLIKLAAGFLHLSRRNRRGARNKLSEGIDQLEPYEPIHDGIGVSELVGQGQGGPGRPERRRQPLPHPAQHPLRGFHSL